MHRFSHRFMAASIAAVLLLVLLLAPVAVHAAPRADRATFDGWGTALLSSLEAAIHDAWHGVARTFAASTAPEEGEAPQAVGSPDDAVSLQAEPDTEGELQPSWDPDGNH